jgi:hypothetical protein
MLICVGCKKQIKYRFRVDPEWKGYFPRAIGARWCPRCMVVKQLAELGDSECQKWVKNHEGSYA